MTYKWIGAIFVVAGCSGFGFRMASVYRKQERFLRQMLLLLEDMTCQLQYKLLPLPELCRVVARRIDGPLRSVMRKFAEEMEQQVAPDAASCMAAALVSVDSLNGKQRLLCSELGHCLGVYDLPGQLKGLELVRKNCERVLKNMECNRELRIRNYQTLGICAGIALAILFI
jgi:stage III sporulation protein AB